MALGEWWELLEGWVVWCDGALPLGVVCRCPRVLELCCMMGARRGAL